MAKDRMNVLELLRKEAPDADLDFLREGIQAVMEAEVATKTGASFGERSSERITYRNGYRTRPSWAPWKVPKVREGSYFPSLLEPRRRSERALLAVVQQAYVEGVSTRRVENLVQALGCEGISKSQVSRICSELDAVVGPSLDGGPYPYLWRRADPEGAGRTDRQRERRGGHPREGKRCASMWAPARTRSLTARGLGGVELVTSDAHQGLKDAIASSAAAPTS